MKAIAIIVSLEYNVHVWRKLDHLNLFKAFIYIGAVGGFDIFLPIFLHTFATCSELPSKKSSVEHTDRFSF